MRSRDARGCKAAVIVSHGGDYSLDWTQYELSNDDKAMRWSDTELVTRAYSTIEMNVNSSQCFRNDSNESLPFCNFAAS